MRPPLERWVTRCIAPADREYIAGDLREEYAVRRRSDGRAAAGRWYLAEIAAALRHRVGAALAGSGGGRVGLGPRGARGASTLGQDVRFAARGLQRSPGHAALVVGTLAVGIGAATAVFTVVDRVLLRLPPFPRAEQLVAVWNTYPDWRGHEVLDPYWDRIPFSYPEYLDWREGQKSFESVAIYGWRQMTVSGSGTPVRLDVGLASATLFPLLGMEPALGRTFASNEEGVGAPRVAILGHSVWRDRFGARNDVLGSTIRLDGTAFTIIGVLPPRFRFRWIGAGNDGYDVWIPVGSDGDSLDRGSHGYEGIARFAGGAIPPAVAEETGRLLGGEGYPGRRGARVVPRHDEEVRDTRGPLLLVFAAAGLLMTLACVNVAALFLGRILARRGELATRTALGAGKWRILRQLAVEALVLGGLGVLGGLALARIGVGLLIASAPADLHLPAGVGLDPRVLGFSMALGILTSLVFGLAPGALLRKGDLDGQLRRASGRLLSGGRRFQRTLVGAQFALSLMLLVGAGLLGRSLAAELDIDPGFDAGTLLSFDVALPPDAYASNPARSAFFASLVERLEAIPGVETVSGASALPFSGQGGSSSFQIVGREVPESQKKPEALRRTVLPGFFETLGIPLLRGRTFVESDRDGVAEAVVISRTMERRFWPDGDALGARIERDRRTWEIVGVVDDVLVEDLVGEPKPTFYTPFHQAERRERLTLIVRTDVRPARLAPQIRETVWDIDGSLPVENLREVQALLDEATAPQRYRAMLLALFAVLATTLAAVGTFGVTSRTLVHRTREMGIRVALGAAPGRLIGQVVRGEAPALFAGVAGGLGVALVMSRALDPFLYDVPHLDPFTYGVAITLLGATGLSAALLAARRVARLDPARVLRAD